MHITFPRLLRGPVMPDPRLPDSRLWLLNLVITRGTPPRLEGCRPASRGLALALMTGVQPIAWHRVDANPTPSPFLGARQRLLVGWPDEQPLAHAPDG